MHIKVKKLIAASMAMAVLFNSSIAHAANKSTLDYSNSVKSYTWSVNNQGYRVYIEDQQGKRVSKILDIGYTSTLPVDKEILYKPETGNGYKSASNISGTDILMINFNSLEYKLDAEKYIPISIGYKIDTDGNVSYDIYKSDSGKSAILAWLLGEDNDYYTFVSKNTKLADYSTIQEAFDTTPETKTIYLDSGTYTEAVNGITTTSDGVPMYTGNVDNGHCLVGLSRYASRPLIVNTSLNESKMDTEFGEYNHQPLMMAYGFVKDVDMYQTVGFCQFHYIVDHSTGDIYKPTSAMSYTFHCESTNSVGKKLSFENCVLKNNGGSAAGMGLYGGMGIQFKDCVLESTELSSGGAIFVHDCGNTEKSLQGESSLQLNNCLLKTRSFLSKKGEKDKAPSTMTMFNYIEQSGEKTINSASYILLNCKIDNDTDNDIWASAIINKEVTDETGNKTTSMEYANQKKFKLANRQVKNVKYDFANGEFNTGTAQGTALAELANKAEKSSTLAEISKDVLTGDEDTPRLNRLLNMKINGKYYFDNIYGNGLKIGDENEDGEEIINAVEMMCENNYKLVIEPLIWVKPAKSINGEYVSSSDKYIYGGYAEVLKYLSEHTDKFGDEDECNVYKLFETIHEMCKKA